MKSVKITEFYRKFMIAQKKKRIDELLVNGAFLDKNTRIALQHNQKKLKEILSGKEDSLDKLSIDRRTNMKLLINAFGRVKDMAAKVYDEKMFSRIIDLAKTQRMEEQLRKWELSQTTDLTSNGMFCVMHFFCV